ncbi:MAG: esterase [Acidobacteria bacterium]|nr:esterase [Acidobacteriota bacterium]
MRGRAFTGAVFLLSTLALPAGAGVATERNLVRRTLEHGGIERTYHVHYPNRQRPGATLPVVIVLHGGGGAGARSLAARTGFNGIADREGFIVVYPAGIDGQWNDGRGKTFRRAKDNTSIDDVGFIAAIVDALVVSGEGDRRRVYVAGVSNGGMMAQRVGIELGSKVAAIAAVIANLPANLAGRAPVRPLPVLVMNGTADPLVPWHGGPVRVLGREYGHVLSTEATVGYWVRAAGLPAEPDTRLLDDRDPRDRCRAEVRTYRAAARPVEVVLYSLQGAGHNLPGGRTPDLPKLVGPQCRDINGSEVIWDFFARHALTP